MKKILVFEAYPFFSGAQRNSRNTCEIMKKHLNCHLVLGMADDEKGDLAKNYSGYVDDMVVLPTANILKKYGSGDNWLTLKKFFPAFFLGLLPLYFSVFKLLRKHKFNIIFFSDPRGAVILLPVAIFFKAKKIMYFQSKNRVGGFISKNLFVRFCDYIICPSKDVLLSIPASKKVKIIHYGVDVEQYKNIDPAVVSNQLKQMLSQQDLVRTKLLFAGLIKPQKGLHHLVYALEYLKSKLPEEKMPLLFILGNPKSIAEQQYQEKLIQFLQDKNLTQYVRWMGFQTNVLEWMKNMNYFIFPTINREENVFEGFDSVIESTEGSPTVLIESSLCELYTLASLVTGVNETITEQVNGETYNPDRPNDLKEKLLELIIQKPLFKGFPNRMQFHPQTFAEHFLKLID